MLLLPVMLIGGIVAAGVSVYNRFQRPKADPAHGTPVAPGITSGLAPAGDRPPPGGLAQTSWRNRLQATLHGLRGRQFRGIITGGGQSEAGSELDEIDRQIDRQLVLTVSLFGLSGLGRLGFPGLLVLAFPGFIYLSIPFVADAYTQLVKERRVGLGVVDAVLGIAMISLGYFVTLSLFGSMYLASRKILLRTRDNSRKSLVNIFDEQPRSVWLVRNGVEIEVPFPSLEVGDVVVVGGGDVIPVDGSIVAGIASVDQRMLTGEAQPCEKETGDLVLGGTMVLAGRILIRVDKTGAETVTAQIGEFLRRTADHKSSLELRGEVIAANSAVPMLVLGALTLPILGPRAAVAVVACAPGYNLRLTGPMSVLNFLYITSRNGILVKDGRAFEGLNRVDTVIFDKTGTLTREQPQVRDIHPCRGHTVEALLRYAAAAEHRQKHPIARAIVQETHARQLEVPVVAEADCEVGYGIKTRVFGDVVRVGSARFMDMEQVDVPAEMWALQEDRHKLGHSLVYIAVRDRLGGVIELQPSIRPEAKAIIDGLRRRGMTMHIMSGDHEEPTKRLARELGIDHYVAEALPEQKASVVETLQQEGRSVCFVGDGVNDSIALKRADVSVSLSGATTIAADTANIVLMDGSLNQLVRLFDLAAELETNIRGDFLASVIPAALAVAGVYGLGMNVVVTSVLGYLGLAAGVGNAMLPLVVHGSELPATPRHGQSGR